MSNYYNDIAKKNLEIMQLTLSDTKNSSIQGDNHSFLNDLSKWADILEGRLENEIYKTAFKEYQYCLIFALQGYYRQAYNSLRFFIEHTHAGLYFSVRELELRQWIDGKRDIYWNNILDENTGFFSTDFFKVFAPDFIEELSSYKTLAKLLYRECSEFIHGNYSTYSAVPNTLYYDENTFKTFSKKVNSSINLITFSLTSRYLNVLNDKQKSELESSILDRIGHIKVLD
ncbi:hypothetical protein [Saccharibacillus sp. JS10]|uniref:hypothetical protein n=1 Tax=Saccharibacillus sp. JS10 TaxID=2950552 RepID=UPI002108E0DA|nr:hypothetical protein [Saccharibacillus sp. JS10]MCQ4088250.1 hypothetical protein [Saccharibacillus sp. JS10]